MTETPHEISSRLSPLRDKIINPATRGLRPRFARNYTVGRSSFKWYRYLFWFLIDVSICNSFILYNHHKLEQGQGKVKQLNFRTNLAKQLIGGFSSTVSAGHSAKRRKIDNLSLDPGNKGNRTSIFSCSPVFASWKTSRPERKLECILISY